MSRSPSRRGTGEGSSDRLALSGFLFLVIAAWSGFALASDPPIGQRPAVEDHLDQAAVDAVEISFEELFEHGELLFVARFDELDGQGRTGGSRPSAGEPRAAASESAPGAAG